MSLICSLQDTESMTELVAAGRPNGICCFNLPLSPNDRKVSPKGCENVFESSWNLQIGHQCLTFSGVVHSLEVGKAVWVGEDITWAKVVGE